MDLSIKALGKKVYKKIMKRSHDFVERTMSFGELYENVPDELKDVRVNVLEIHSYKKKDKKKIIKWLNR